jgi:hypothetical protein
MQRSHGTYLTTLDVDRKRCELPRRPGGYERVLKRVGIQY